MTIGLPTDLEKTSHREALLRLKACFWRGSVRPFRGKVEEPIPSELGAFGGIKNNWFKWIYESDSELVRRSASLAAKGKKCDPLEYRMVIGNDQIAWVRHWFFPPSRARGDKLNQVRGFVQVLEERNRLEAECLKVCEREKAAIGQELHDDVCQLLAGIACVMQVVSQKAKAAMPEMTSTLMDLSSQLQAGMERTRSLAHGLVPMRLVTMGLLGSLRELASQSEKNFNIQVHVIAPRVIPPQTPEQILHLYRIVQEAVGNAYKHGKATKIGVKLSRARNQMTLTIQDNGSGMPAESRRKQGIGLHIMRYRASAIDGRVQICSTLGKGSMISVTYGGSPGVKGLVHAQS